MLSELQLLRRRFLRLREVKIFLLQGLLQFICKATMSTELRTGRRTETAVESSPAIPFASSFVFCKFSWANCKSRLSWTCLSFRSANGATSSQDFCKESIDKRYQRQVTPE